jgi:hypothetical protein
MTLSICVNAEILAALKGVLIADNLDSAEKGLKRVTPLIIDELEALKKTLEIEKKFLPDMIIRGKDEIELDKLNE